MRKLAVLLSHMVNSPLTVVKHVVTRRKLLGFVLLHSMMTWLPEQSVFPTKAHQGTAIRATSHLQSNVQVEKANGAPLPQLVLLLGATHLHDTQRLGLCRKGLHTQRLQAVLGETEMFLTERRVKKGTIDAGCMDLGKEGMVTILGSVEDELDPFQLSWNSLLRFLHGK